MPETWPLITTSVIRQDDDIQSNLYRNFLKIIF